DAPRELTPSGCRPTRRAGRHSPGGYLPLGPFGNPLERVGPVAHRPSSPRGCRLLAAAPVVLLLFAIFATLAPAPAAAQGFQGAIATGVSPEWREENLLQNGDFSETDQHGGPAFWEPVGAEGVWRADGGQD